VEILGNIGSVEAVDPLIVLLQDEKDPSVIEEAITSLGKIGGDDVLDYLSDFLSENDRSTAASFKKRLIYAIGSIKNQKSLLALIDLLKNIDTSKNILKKALPRLDRERDCICASALENAVVTRPEAITPAAKKRLALIIGKYVK